MMERLLSSGLYFCPHAYVMSIRLGFPLGRFRGSVTDTSLAYDWIHTAISVSDMSVAGSVLRL